MFNICGSILTRRFSYTKGVKCTDSVSHLRMHRIKITLAFSEIRGWGSCVNLLHFRVVNLTKKHRYTILVSQSMYALLKSKWLTPHKGEVEGVWEFKIREFWNYHESRTPRPTILKNCDMLAVLKEAIVFLLVLKGTFT